tara:strand:- start:217 stop:1281 length:1065 start_codon:yes stop_codon:yes gene_type:complete
MKVGVISYYGYNNYLNLKNKKDYSIYESWEKAWKEVYKLCNKYKITLEEYSKRDHLNYEKLLFIEIPRIQDLSLIIFSNLFIKKIKTILIINETFIGRARYMLRIPFLFDSVYVNSECELSKYMAYKVKTFSYPTLPSKNVIFKREKTILNKNRKNKIVFIGSFKLAINKYGSYIFRYKLIKGLTKFPKYFSLYGFNWDKKQIPFDLVGIAIIKRIKFIEKIFKNIIALNFPPLGKFSISKSKLATMENYEFSLAIEPTVGKFNSICEKIFDPMICGTIPIYYGQKNLKDIPINSYIRIDKTTKPRDIIDIIKNTSKDERITYRKNIYKFLISESAKKYRYETYANFIISTIKK